jgi:hypothetical protein
VGGIDLDGLRVVQERVEPGAAEHADPCFGHEDEGSFAVPDLEPVPVSEPFDGSASEPFDDDPPSEVEDPDEAPDEDPEDESEDEPEDEEDEPPSESFFDPVLAGARLSVA